MKEILDLTELNNEKDIHADWFGGCQLRAETFAEQPTPDESVIEGCDQCHHDQHHDNRAETKSNSITHWGMKQVQDWSTPR